MILAALFTFQFFLLAQFAETAPSESSSTYSYCPAASDEDWSYKGPRGPMFWGEVNDACNGKKQSPIHINSKSAVMKKDLKKLVLYNYDTPLKNAATTNNRYTIKVDAKDGVERNLNIDNSTYTLVQLHFHWGDANYRGSEHIIDGAQYAMEMHLVHMNKEGQLAVVGVLFYEQPDNNIELQKIVEVLPKLRYRDSKTELLELNLNKLLPENPASFYRYDGSLTTPGCSEGVIWSVLTKIQTVGNLQMNEYRNLYSAPQGETRKACKLWNNYRPTQPLNNRKVYLSQ